MFTKKYWAENYKAILLAVLAVAMAVGFGVAASGCNTISGLAKDVGAMSDGTKAFLVKED